MEKSFITTIVLAIVLLSSCRWEIERVPHRRDEGEKVSRNEEDDPPSAEEADTTVYTLGIEFPLSYDWRRDSAYGNIRSRIVLFANQKRIVEVDAGPGTGISADPDMHRIWDGHLYSDSCIGDETVVYLDGEELFRYPGREMICGFMVLDGRVHTLGQSRSGPGFSYRIDGESIVSDPGGSIVGDFYSRPSPSGTMYLDDGLLCFGFRGGDGNWYAARDGETAKVNPCGLEEIFDIRYIGGRLSLCGTAPRYRGRAVLVHEGRMQPLWDREVKATGYGQILPSEGELYVVEGHIRSDGSTESSIWQSGQTRNYGTNIESFMVSDGNYATVTSRTAGRLGTVRSNEGFWWFSDEMLMMSHACTAYRKGVVLIAATPVRKELSPVLWKNGRSLALTINGYLAGISFAKSLE